MLSKLPLHKFLVNTHKHFRILRQSNQEEKNVSLKKFKQFLKQLAKQNTKRGT